jgi:hypothetical protein
MTYKTSPSDYLKLIKFETYYIKGVIIMGGSDSHLCVVIGFGQLMHQS